MLFSHYQLNLMFNFIINHIFFSILHFIMRTLRINSVNQSITILIYQIPSLNHHISLINNQLFIFLSQINSIIIINLSITFLDSYFLLLN